MILYFPNVRNTRSNTLSKGHKLTQFTTHDAPSNNLFIGNPFFEKMDRSSKIQTLENAIRYALTYEQTERFEKLQWELVQTIDFTPLSNAGDDLEIGNYALTTYTSRNGELVQTSHAIQYDVESLSDMRKFLLLNSWENISENNKSSHYKRPTKSGHDLIIISWI